MFSDEYGHTYGMGISRFRRSRKANLRELNCLYLIISTAFVKSSSVSRIPMQNSTAKARSATGANSEVVPGNWTAG